MRGASWDGLSAGRRNPRVSSSGWDRHLLARRRYRERHRDALRVKRRDYYLRNREHILAHKRAFYQANQDRVNARRRALYAARKTA